MRGVIVMVFSLILACSAVAASSPQDPAHPIPGMVDAPTVKILRGLTVPEFEAEMQLMNQALGVCAVTAMCAAILRASQTPSRRRRDGCWR